ncbi:MAG: Lrp/AsnC family transcriptional regulator [Candidatus Micrarchaeota archaeon]
MNKSKKKSEKPSFKLDELDLKIIQELRSNSRQSWRELARKIDTSPVTIINRIKILEKNKVITGYSVRLDYKKMGMDLACLTGVSVPGKHYSKVLKDLMQMPEISDIYAVSGEFDLMIYFRAKNADELTRIVQTIYRKENVKTQTYFSRSLKEDYQKNPSENSLKSA